MTLRRLLVLGFWSALLIAFILALLPKPPHFPGEPSDKVQHIFAFTVLAALGRAAYPGEAALKLAVGLSAFGALIEIFQGIPVLHRDPEILDWIADTGAVLVVLAIAGLIRRLRR
jgi:hypothetical protein